jgi:hypothetical protein
MADKIRKLSRFAVACISGLAISFVNATVMGQSQVIAEDAPSPTPMLASGTESIIDSGMGGGYAPAAGHACLGDLTLSNFFSAGWNEDYAPRVRDTGTPDLPLLRAQTNNQQRLFRMNFFDESLINSATKKDLVDTDGFIDWSFNRRFMVELEYAYQWGDPRTGGGASGGATGVEGRFQLYDTEATSLCFNCKVLSPNAPLGTTQSTFTYGFAGFEDLSHWFPLDRVGLYYSFVFDSYYGPAAKGTKLNDIQYDISVAKTITDPNTPIFGKLTLFLETFATTNLDGSETGQTLLTITPGLRFNMGTAKCVKMGSDNVVILGADIPVSEYHAWDAIYRFTYIKCF